MDNGLNVVGTKASINPRTDNYSKTASAPGDTALEPEPASEEPASAPEEEEPALEPEEEEEQEESEEPEEPEEEEEQEESEEPEEEEEQETDEGSSDKENELVNDDREKGVDTSDTMSSLFNGFEMEYNTTMEILNKISEDVGDAVSLEISKIKAAISRLDNHKDNKDKLEPVMKILSNIKSKIKNGEMVGLPDLNSLRKSLNIRWEVLEIASISRKIYNIFSIPGKFNDMDILQKLDPLINDIINMINDIIDKNEISLDYDLREGYNVFNENRVPIIESIKSYITDNQLMPVHGPINEIPQEMIEINRLDYIESLINKIKEEIDEKLEGIDETTIELMERLDNLEQSNTDNNQGEVDSGQEYLEQGYKEGGGKSTYKRRTNKRRTNRRRTNRRKTNRRRTNRRRTNRRRTNRRRTNRRRTNRRRTNRRRTNRRRTNRRRTNRRMTNRRRTNRRR